MHARLCTSTSSLASTRPSLPNPAAPLAVKYVNNLSKPMGFVQCTQLRNSLRTCQAVQEEAVAEFTEHSELPEDMIESYDESYNDDGSDPNKDLLSALPAASNTKIKSAEYITSCVDVESCPAPEFPEFAVIGRSNVGKSSLINMLTNSKRLAHVSKEPGKTRCINHFLINGNWYLVDLPGYGYARTGQSMRSTFDKFTKQYFLKRPSLAMVYLLADSSIAPQKIDLEYAAWLYRKKVPFTLVFTKADKRKKGQAKCRDNVYAFKAALEHEHGVAEAPPAIITSSESGLGRTSLLHMTCILRDSFAATGKLEEAMVAWKRWKVLGDAGDGGPEYEGPSSASHSDDEDEEQLQQLRNASAASSSSSSSLNTTTTSGQSHNKQSKSGSGGGSKGGSTKAPVRPASLGITSASKALAKNPAASATGKKAGLGGRGKPLPGDNIPLPPQWKVRAGDRMSKNSSSATNSSNGSSSGKESKDATAGGAGAQ